MADKVPAIKYVGSKRRLVDYIEAQLGTDYDVIVEPFCGSLVFSMHTGKPFLGVDTSLPLINFYKHVLSNPTKLIREIKGMEARIRSKSDFETLVREDRCSDYSSKSDLYKAARFYTVLYRSFNGLFRVSMKGQCNSPYGGDSRKLVDTLSADIYNIKEHLRKNIYGVPECRSFETTLEDIESMLSKGLRVKVLIDPPYRGTFVEYTAERDRGDFYERLRNYVNQLREWGVHFILTNSPHEDNLALFRDYYQEQIPIKYSIAANGERRVVKTELVVSNQTIKGYDFG